MSFLGLIVHFFLTPNHIPLSGCTAAYLSTHLLKDILVASKFRQWWIKLLLTSAGKYLYGHTFSTRFNQAAWLLDHSLISTYGILKRSFAMIRTLCICVHVFHIIIYGQSMNCCTQLPQIKQSNWLDFISPQTNIWFKLHVAFSFLHILSTKFNSFQ